MGLTWKEADDLLRWDKRREPDLPPRHVYSHDDTAGESWSVSAKRGTRAPGKRNPGNRDVIAVLERSSLPSEQTIASFKDLAGDLFKKVGADREWMRHFFLPASIDIVVFGEDPEEALVGPIPDLPGIPPQVLLTVLQVICLSEWRKYKHKEPYGGRYLPLRVCAGIAWGVWAEQDLSYGAFEQNTVAIMRFQSGVREPALGLVLASSSNARTRELTPDQLMVLSL